MPIDNISSTNKYSAYRRIADDYEAAKKILSEKKLAFGECAVVPFYYPNKTDVNRKVRLLQGIGSLNGEVELLPNVIGSTTILDDGLVTIPDSSIQVTLHDMLKYLLDGAIYADDGQDVFDIKID